MREVVPARQAELVLGLPVSSCPESPPCTKDIIRFFNWSGGAGALVASAGTRVVRGGAAGQVGGAAPSHPPHGGESGAARRARASEGGGRGGVGGGGSKGGRGRGGEDGGRRRVALTTPPCTNRYSPACAGTMGEDKRLFLSNGGGGEAPRPGGVGARLLRGRQAKQGAGRGGGDSDGMMGSGGESDSSEEIHYGPGFVSRLKSRYMSVALRGSARGSLGSLRRSASLEDFLDIDRNRAEEEVELQHTEVVTTFSRHSAPMSTQPSTAKVRGAGGPAGAPRWCVVCSGASGG